MGNPLTPLVDQLKKLPGIGEKSAQRLAFFFLSLPKDDVQQFSSILTQTRQNIQYCERCFNISLENLCHICIQTHRLQDQLCVVAEPRDIFALERTHEYKGVYHVLGGLISPLDGVHPESLRLAELAQKLKNFPFKEIILAINPTIEGDATLLYLKAYLKSFNIPMSKLAYGLPMGADMDYADEITLQKAFHGRRNIDE